MYIIVNGFPRSGKDTFMDFACDRISAITKKGPFVYISIKHSTIDTVKEIATSMGWDGEKTPDNRCMLSELKDLYTKYFDGPLNELKDLRGYDFVFTAMREPNEIKRMKEWCAEAHTPCYSILIRGAREETAHDSHSDADILKGEYDFIIGNYGSLDNLQQTANDSIEYIMKRKYMLTEGIVSGVGEAIAHPMTTNNTKELL